MGFSPEKIYRWIPGWMRLAGVGLILVFLVATLISGYEQIAQVTWNLNLPVLLLALATLIVYMVIQGMLWTWMLRRMELPLPYSSGLQIFLWSHLARYIPGGIWAFASVGVSASQAGLPVGVTVFTFTLSMILIVVVSSLYAIPVVISILPLEIVIALCVLGIAVLVLVMPAAIRFVLRRLNSNDTIFALSVEPLLQSRQLLLLLAFYAMTHLLAMASFAFYFHGIVGASLTESIYASFAWSGAWVIGFIVLVAPSGLGVREGAMVALLAPVLPTAVAIAIAFGFRLFTTIMDVVILLSLVLGKRFPRGLLQNGMRPRSADKALVARKPEA